MSKHTQGPWKADGYSIRQASTGTRHVAEIAYTGPHHTPPNEYPKSCRLQDEANARLIAAAPSLLDALIRLRAAFNGDSIPEVDMAMDEAESAIKQATSEKP